MNIEQGISNDEFEKQIIFTSKFIIPRLNRAGLFIIRYSIIVNMLLQTVFEESISS